MMLTSLVAVMASRIRKTISTSQRQNH